MKHRRAGLLVLQLRIVVADHDNIGTAQEFIELFAPFSDAAGVRGRRIAKLYGGVGILLALADQHGLLGAPRLDQLAQAVEHDARALDLPYPAALAVRSPLLKSLDRVGGVEAHHFEQQCASFIAVRISRADRRPVAAFPVTFWRRRLVDPSLIKSV